MFTQACLMVGLLTASGWAAPADGGAPLTELNKLPFFYAREYFVLRSGGHR